MWATRLYCPALEDAILLGTDHEFGVEAENKAAAGSADKVSGALFVVLQLGADFVLFGQYMATEKQAFSAISSDNVCLRTDHPVTLSLAHALTYSPTHSTCQDVESGAGGAIAAITKGLPASLSFSSFPITFNPVSNSGSTVNMAPVMATYHGQAIDIAKVIRGRVQ